MKTPSQAITFSQLHIDAARNSTDDFNLFHDKNKWHRIRGNPYEGPIVLGFQLEALIEDRIRAHRRQHDECELMKISNLRYSNYQFSFTNAVKAEQSVTVDIKPSQFKDGDNASLKNRVIVKSADNIVLIGHKQETQAPLFLPNIDFSGLGNLRRLPDRTFLSGNSFFLKRKFMTTSNAKNFLLGSNVEQSLYFDELEDKVKFPETFVCSLISCALLEMALTEKHDFETAPMVYTSHQISVDRLLLDHLRSNDALHILVKPPVTISNKGLGSSGISQHIYECYGLVGEQQILYRALIALAPLEEILISFMKRTGGDA